MTRTLLALLCLGFAAATLPVNAQSDLDAFMEKVLARRDDNWKKLQQYVLDEKEAFNVSGPGGYPLWGMRREYTWFIRDGVFIRSPLTADGVKLSDEDRRRAEAQWLRRQRNREENEKRRAERRARGEDPAGADKVVEIGPGSVKVSSSDDEPAAAPITNTDDMLKQMREPQFVSSAYFLKFKFETGQYALAGRENISGVETLKIEYYPRAGLFKDGRTRPNKEVRKREDDVEDKMNKASMVTLWIEPKSHQILQYVFSDIDWDFFPGRSLVRVGDVAATMQMTQAFPNVWLPRSIEMRFEMMLAVGPVEGAYQVEYLNYKEAAVTYKIK
jgi:hypothetical protein